MNECEQLRERGCNSDAIKIYQQEIEEFFVPLQIAFDELKASTEPIQAHFLQRWRNEKKRRYRTSENQRPCATNSRNIDGDLNDWVVTNAKIEDRNYCRKSGAGACYNAISSTPEVLHNSSN